METDFDVVIIGSGAGGAPIAYTLANAGKTVLILEKGPLFLTQSQSPDGISDWKRDELFATGPEKILNHPGLSNNGASYYQSHVEPDLNDEPHVYQDGLGRDQATVEGYTAQVVGGGTQLYGAVHLRFSPLDFQLKTLNDNRTDLRNDPNGDVRREARDWPFTYKDFEPYYVKTEHLIGINGSVDGQIKKFSKVHYQKPLDPNPISKFALEGMQIIGKKYGPPGKPLSPYRTPLAVITEDHAPSGRKADLPKTAFVNRYGDPLGLKSSTWNTLLYPIRDRFELRTNCTVTHLESENGSVNTVWYYDPSGYRRTVRGKLVIVACSAIESVRLLQISALSSMDFDMRIHQNDLLGKYFLTHCFGGAETPMPGRYDKTLSLDSDWATDVCGTEFFLKDRGLWAGAAIYNNTSDQALPLSMARTHGSTDLDTFWQGFAGDSELRGDRLMEFLDETAGKRLSVSFMANQVPLKSNRIELHPNVRDKWGRPVAYILKDWHPHDRYLMDTMASVCRDILAWGGDPVGGTYPVEGFGSVYTGENARSRIANHILGGARFGTDRKDSVLDPNCKVWEFDNLYVTDGSFMPTSGGANPTHTIQANAFRVAEHLLTRL